jgi:CBS domain containing-hemolysin-like protein
MWLFFLSVFGALAISAFCSLMEASLLSLRPSQIADISARRPKIGAIWTGFKDQIERPIAAILILNTTAHTIGAAVAGAEFGKSFGEKWIWAFSLIFTLLMLQFTEILPKSAGVRYNQRIALWIARPLNWLIYLLAPVVHFVYWVNRLLFGNNLSEGQKAATVEEISALAGLARLTKEISPSQERVIEGGARISHLKVRAVMQHRIEIDALEIDTPADQVAGAVVMSGFSRVPVYQGNLDNIIGFVYIKDILLQIHMGWPLELEKLLRPVPFVPETLPLDRLLQVFHEERTQMAIVLDEHGGTTGLVTMEDILEEFVGEIYDEHRPTEEEIIRRDATSWFTLGSASLRDLLEKTRQPELWGLVPDDINTVGGLIQKLLDRVPDVDDRVIWNHMTFQVVAMDGQRVGRVLVTLGKTQ